MNKSENFYTFVLGFAVAIFICSYVKLGWGLAIFLLTLSSLIFIFRKLLTNPNGLNLIRQEGRLILLAIFIFSFALGILRYDFKDWRNEPDQFADLVGKKVTLIGVIADEPNITEKSAQLIVEVTQIKMDPRLREDDRMGINERVLVSAGLFPQFTYGDLIKAEGKLEKPQNIISTTSPDFDYVNYLAKDDIFYELSFANAQLISGNHGSWLKTKLLKFKSFFMDRINSLIREPESSLLGGLLLGTKNSLGRDWQLNFRKAGVSHIVALSGYNITIVAEGIMVALSFLPRMLAMSFGALGIILFAIMTGASATVLRASAMALLVLLAKATGRTYDVVRALFLAGLFMLIQNPKVLVFDISFQLSFLSTIALIFVSPIIENRLVFITRKISWLKFEKGQWRELILATISTQIFVLPFIFYKMGMISLVSLPTNLLVLPLIPTIMLFGFITGLFALIFSPLAIPFALVSSLLLSYVLKVISLFAGLPFSALSLKNFPLYVVVLIYLIYGVIIWRFQKVSRRPPSLD